ncbi:hypothetical protein [Lysinibacillus sp. NPDC093688]|uniref:hypothetical protein n=1 Tax=Lysinibacillus sp. NPDC093688 TaxID=3390577 RepID=UPI003CFCDFE5
MKKKIIFFIALFLIAIVSIYFFYEYKTKNLVEDFFSTDSLAEETHHISIIKNDKERNITTIKKDSTLFPTFIKSLEKLKVKRTSSANFTYIEGYTFIIFHNNDLHSIHLNENGILTFNNKTYEIQNKQSFEDFLEIVKKSTQ